MADLHVHKHTDHWEILTSFCLFFKISLSLVCFGDITHNRLAQRCSRVDSSRSSRVVRVRGSGHTLRAEPRTATWGRTEETSRENGLGELTEGRSLSGELS